jgi:hypothetical protein
MLKQIFLTSILILCCQPLFALSTRGSEEISSLHGKVLNTYTTTSGESVTIRMDQMSKWAFGLKYNSMLMQGLQDHSHNISKQDVFNQGYANTPTKMTVDMLTANFMYMLNPHISFMIMSAYLKKQMDNQNRSGQEFTTNASGITDTEFFILYNLLKNKKQSFDIHFGISLPTGSINKKDNVPAGRILLPYPMQLGSGTFDPVIDIEYIRLLSKTLSWETEFNTDLHLYKNNNHYALGNEYAINTSLNNQFNSIFAGFITLDGASWGNIRGANPELNPLASPTANPKTQGGKSLSLLLGIELEGQKGIWKKQSLQFDIGNTVSQYTNGPQLKKSWEFSVQWVLR